MTDISLFPDGLAKILHGMNQERITIGCTKDTVIRFWNDKNAYFLKIGRSNPEAHRERDMLRWLKGKLPVPDIIYWHEAACMFYLLTTTATGIMACTERGLSGEEPEVVRALTDGLIKFQSIDIASCPIQNRLKQRLASALYNIENDLVDMDDFAGNGRFGTPIELFDYLVKNKPIEDLCLTHGDYCLPNIFITSGKATGFIDMGRGGIADKYQDIALCYRSLGYNTFERGDKGLLFEYLGIKPDWDKIDYYILLDELF